MATFTLTGMSPYHATNLTTPGWAGRFPNPNDEYRLDPDWSQSTHGLTFTVTDDDGELSGDPSEYVGADASQQTAVVTNASGNVIASGYLYTEYAFIVEGPNGDTIEVQAVEIGGTLVGYISDSPVQPGANYMVTSSYNPNGTLSPSYAEFDALEYEQSDDNVMQGTVRSDYFKGGAGEDTLSSGAGADTLDGGAGNDTLDGGLGDDRLTGGGGDDTFVLPQGNDTITDFNAAITGAIGDGDSTNNDFVDLSGHYDTLDELRADHEDDGILNQSNAFDDEGKAVDYSDNTQFGANSLTMQGADGDSFTYDSTGIVCFALGTRILTPDGEIPIETLRPGDLVMTLDHGPQPLVWIGMTHVSQRALRDDVKLRPVLIRRGALGNTRELLVSRQHGLMIGRKHLVRAVHLTRGTRNIRIAHGKRGMCYVHLLFARHQIVLSEGIPSESFYPGPNALRSLGPQARRDLCRVLPALATSEALEDRRVVEAVYGPTARPFANPQAVRFTLGPRELLGAA